VNSSVINPPKPLPWQFGIIESIKVETYRVKTFTINLKHWRPFISGQHYDIRLTAPDGYQAQRSYSIASSPTIFGKIELTVELIPDGEVSQYFHRAIQPGEALELRGPIGGPFSWKPNDAHPSLFVAGGSGIVPIMSMLRHRIDSGMTVKAALIYSSRSFHDIIYWQELSEMNRSDDQLSITHTLTRQQPDWWTGYSRHIDDSMAAIALHSLGSLAHAYICGSTPFVETVSDALLETGMKPGNVLTEHFGPTM